MSGISMAVVDAIGRLLAVITVTIPSAQFTRERISDCLGLLETATQETSERLGRSSVTRLTPP